MRFRFLSALFIAAAAGTTYWYVTTKNICPAPLQYRLGELDSSFSISADEAKQHLLTAELIWEQAADRELFVYDESADFTVNFVFDDRQALADSESVQSASLDQKRLENETIISTIETLQTDYDALLQAYNSSVTAYESRLAAYNQTVRQYNDQGGAPQSVYADLQAEQRALDAEANGLQIRSDELNSLVTQLNRLQAESNQRVESYNREVQRFNRQFGYEREFTQGDYQGDSINIYKFSSDAELISVLTHEFGHALGIEHVEDDSSVMYYLLLDESETPTLSDADKAALQEVCGDGTGFTYELRRFIRNTIEAIT